MIGAFCFVPTSGFINSLGYDFQVFVSGLLECPFYLVSSGNIGVMSEIPSDQTFLADRLATPENEDANALVCGIFQAKSREPNGRSKFAGS